MLEPLAVVSRIQIGTQFVIKEKLYTYLISVWLWNFKDGGTKKQDFCPRINMLKGKLFFKSANELRFIEQCQNLTFKVNFWCQKSTEFFYEKKSLENINLGDHFLFKTFFSSLNFWTTLFSKIMPNYSFINGIFKFFFRPKILLFSTHHP